MSRATLGVLLLGLWLLLWGSASPANVLSGVAAITLLYLVFPSARPVAPRTFLSPVGLARLLGYFVKQVVISNLLLAREIASPRSRLRAHILEVPMRTTSRPFLTLVANITALTPGTMAVSARAEPPTITVHALVLSDVDAVARALWQLEERCVRAFGTADAVAELAALPLEEAATRARELPVPVEVPGPEEVGR